MAPLEVRNVTTIESTCILVWGQIECNTSVRNGCFAASGPTGFSIVVEEKLSLFVVAGLASILPTCQGAMVAGGGAGEGGNDATSWLVRSVSLLSFSDGVTELGDGGAMGTMVGEGSDFSDGRPLIASFGIRVGASPMTSQSGLGDKA